MAARIEAALAAHRRATGRPVLREID